MHFKIKKLITILNFVGGDRSLGDVDGPFVLAPLVTTLYWTLVNHAITQHFRLMTVTKLGAV